MNTKLLKISVLFLCLLFSKNADAANIHDVIYDKSDSIKVEQLLEESSDMPSSTNWMLHFANKFMGIPYVAHTLDKENEEHLVVNLRQLDCTTYIETILALSKCAQNQQTSFSDYCQWLQDIRYSNGIIAYTKRNHYFTVWIEENNRNNIVENISSTSYPFTAVQNLSVNYMSTHTSSYAMLTKHPEWVPKIKAMEQSMNGKSYRYIPKEKLYSTPKNNAYLEKYIKDGDIIVILTKINGLDTSHIGLAHWHKDGLHMINASSVHKKVIDEPMLLYKYMQQHPKQIGIRVVRPKNT